MDAMKSTERIDPGNDVLGSKGDKLGTVAYVVTKPPKMEVTDLVVSTGDLLGRDVIVPIDKVTSVSNSKVHISLDKAQLSKCQDYVEVNYKAAPVAWLPPAGYLYPAGAMLWPSDYYVPQQASVKVNAPEGTVGISSGMNVKSSDGHTVGSVDGVYIDPADEDVTGLVIKHGFIFTHDTFVPVQYVSDITSGDVNLNLTADEVKKRLEGDS
ncbi:MAG: DUF2171 domain-containing protein [Chloroflexota bacterium]